MSHQRELEKYVFFSDCFIFPYLSWVELGSRKFLAYFLGMKQTDIITGGPRYSWFRILADQEKGYKIPSLSVIKLKLSISDVLISEKKRLHLFHSLITTKNQDTKLKKINNSETRL